MKYRQMAWAGRRRRYRFIDQPKTFAIRRRLTNVTVLLQTFWKIIMNAFCLTRLILLAAAVLAASTGSAQTLTKTEAESVVSETERLIRERFVSPEGREAVIAALQAGRAAGRYDVLDASELANRMTADLQTAGRDKHLGLAWDAEQSTAMLTASAGDREANSSADALAAERADSINHGLVELRTLRGNVRYLRISGFEWIPDVTGRIYDSAMQYLRSGAAVIVDLRGNGGGNSEAVRYAISHFMSGRGEQRLMTVAGQDGKPWQSNVLTYLPAGRIRAPLFVLTDEFTNSAAEEFTYHVKQFSLGKVVGARTRGAGNNNELFPIRPGFILSVSVFRPVHAVGGGNWEGVGIAPDVAVAPARAMETAYAMALEQLAGKAAGPSADVAWALVAARAAINPPAVSASRLKSFAGRYGDRDIVLRNGALRYRRPERPEADLIPLTANIFGLSTTDLVRIRFEPGRITLLYDDGSAVALPRTG